MLVSPTPIAFPRALKSRKNSTVTKWASMYACDVCRLRKVKCVRVKDDRNDCEACTIRNIRCQTSNTKVTGKQHRDTPLTEIEGDYVPLSHRSPESWLHQTELSDAFMAELLASFFKQSEGQVPYTNHKIIQIKFEQAGRRMNQLPQSLEPLILAMCAGGAQITDSRVLLGSYAPLLEQITSVQQYRNLLEFGNRRGALCARLARQLVGLADTRGLYRKATMESITVLALIPRILRHPTVWRGLEDIEDTWRPFMAAAFSHIRELIVKPDFQSDEIETLQWSMIVSDANNAALSGCSLLVTDDDLLDFPNMTDLPPPSPQLTRECLLSNVLRHILRPIQAIARRNIDIGRLIAKTISIPLKKGQDVELSVFAERIQELTSHLHILRQCGRVAEQVMPLVSSVDLEKQQQAFGVAMANSLSLAPVSPTFLMLALHKQFQRCKQQQGFSTLMEGSPQTALLEVQQLLDVGMLDSIFIVTDAIHGLEGKDTVRSLTCQNSMLVAIQKHLLVFFRIACGIPTTEQNGYLAGWTYSIKCQTLRLLLNAAHLQAWSWGDREADLAACEYQCAQYKNSAYYQTLSRAHISEYLPRQGSWDVLSTATSHKSSPFSPSDYVSSSSAGYSELAQDSNDITPDEIALDQITDLAAYTDLWSRDDTSHRSYINSV